MICYPQLVMKVWCADAIFHSHEVMVVDKLISWFGWKTKISYDIKNNAIFFTSFLEEWLEFSDSKLFTPSAFSYQILTMYLFVSRGGAYTAHELRKYGICKESYLKGLAPNSFFRETFF